MMTDTSTGPGRRRWWRVWIYPRFQGTILAINILLLGLVFGTILVLTKRSFDQLVVQGQLSGLQETHPYFQFLRLQFESFRFYLLIAAIVSTGMISLAALILSHRLAAPIVRLKGYFGRIRQNGYGERVSFRDGDFFPELPDLINDALSTVAQGRPSGGVANPSDLKVNS